MSRHHQAPFSQISPSPPLNQSLTNLTREINDPSSNAIQLQNNFQQHFPQTDFSKNEESGNNLLAQYAVSQYKNSLNVIQNFVEEQNTAKFHH